MGKRSKSKGYAASKEAFPNVRVQHAGCGQNSYVGSDARGVRSNTKVTRASPIGRSQQQGFSSKRNRRMIRRESDQDSGKI